MMTKMQEMMMMQQMMKMMEKFDNKRVQSSKSRRQSRFEH